MRLGQLSRQLNIKPTVIVDFLEKEHNLTIENGLNTKVDDKHTELVILNFEVIEEEVIVEELITETVEASNEIEKTIAVEEVKEEISEEPEAKDSVKIDLPEEEPELIKAPKPEPIKGFKVIGKIDLPETVKREVKKVEKQIPAITTSEIEKTTEELENLVKEAKKEEKKPEEKKVVAKKNPIDFHEKKNREEAERKRVKAEKEEQKKRLAAEKRLKEEKTAHYQKQQKQAIAKVNPKKINKKATEEASIEAESPIVHKNLMAKIWHWFNT